MSTFKNAIPQRTYRERAQPASRQRLGLLEKHRDYVLRARDFHKKQSLLKNLKEKARFKNDDEFYFGMIRAQVKVFKNKLNLWNNGISWIGRRSCCRATQRAVRWRWVETAQVARSHLHQNTTCNQPKQDWTFESVACFYSRNRYSQWTRVGRIGRHGGRSG